MSKAYIEITDSIASLSHAIRAKVGTIIVKDNTVIASGYNSTPSCFDSCCERTLSDGSLQTLETVVHAEINAICYCAKHGIQIDGADLYVSYSPCVNCAIAIIQSGIRRVFYKQQYRDISGIKVLEQANIICKQYDRI